MRVLPAAIITALALAAAPARAQDADPLARVRFLVGDFEGQGAHEPWGKFEQRTRGEAELDGTVLTLRSRCRIGEETVFEDLKVFSYDPAKKQIRVRQFLPGSLTEFRVAIGADGALTLTETGHEGRAHPEQRLSFAPAEGGWSYEVAEKKAAGFAVMVSGRLGRRARDPRKAGPEPFAAIKAEIPRAKGEAMAADIFYPKKAEAAPVVILSPGGGAPTTRNYERFGRHFASWGYVAVVVAFNNRSAEERAVNFGEVADWLATRGPDSPLKARMNLEKLVAAGHSFGGYAAVLASQRDRRFTACLALAPSGPRGDFSFDRAVPTLVLVGANDRFLPTDEAIYEKLKGPRYFAAVKGLDHFFNPSSLFPEVLGRGTAFLNLTVRGQGSYRRPLTASDARVRARKGEGD